MQQHLIYQIYPRSFADSNGDGVGDIRGIIGKLDYISALNVDSIWLCPVFCSPMVDNGYDISDYRAVDPLFGTLADLEELIARAKERGMGILLDLVLNHTSDKHAWFQAALADKNSPYRQYYIFRPGKNGRAPNNWRSNFGGSVWEKDENSGEYYYHTFAKEQPDLNWENPALRRELCDMIRWWLEKGVAGFRIDAISFIKKNQRFPDLEPDAADGLANPGSNSLVHDGIGAFLSQLRDEAFKPFNAYTVAEANGLNPAQLAEYIGENGYFSAVFDFSYTDIDLKTGDWHTVHPVDRGELRRALYASQCAVSALGHGAVYLENHDQNRSPNKYLAAGEICFESVTMLGALYFFLQGTAYIYQGQELGYTNYNWRALEQFNDVSTLDQYYRALAAGFSEAQAFSIVSLRSRDNARVPMLWNAQKNGGFTDGTPWLPVYDAADRQSADAQTADTTSVLWFYRKMTALRRGRFADLFYTGSFEPYVAEQDTVFAYRRRHCGMSALIVCNFSGNSVSVNLPAATVLLGNVRETGALSGGSCSLNPFEALVLLETESEETRRGDIHAF